MSKLELMLKPSGWESSRFIEGHTTIGDERLLRELADTIEGHKWYSISSIAESLRELWDKPSKTPVVFLTAFTGLAAIVEVLGGCATLQQGFQIASPVGAPRIVSDYRDLYTTYGKLRSEVGLPPHNGIDIEGRIGDPVYAAADGVVLRSHKDPKAGERLVIEHGQDADGNYLRTLYIHLNKRLVEVGQSVKRGQPIGEVGVTGTGAAGIVPHLHFGVYRGPTREHSKAWSDVNPADYWVGIDEYKKMLEVAKKEKKEDSIKPFIIPCFDSSMTYLAEPIRLTYQCKR